MTNLQTLKSQLKSEKERLSKAYKLQYKHFLIALDCLFILAFLMNLGALTLTNALVTKTTPDIQLVETNPVAAEVHDLETNDTAWIGLLWMFLAQIIPWTILSLLYISSRYNVYSHATFLVTAALVIYIFVACSTDFCNNLGYFIGL